MAGEKNREHTSPSKNKDQGCFRKWRPFKKTIVRRESSTFYVVSEMETELENNVKPSETEPESMPLDSLLPMRLIKPNFESTNTITTQPLMREDKHENEDVTPWQMMKEEVSDVSSHFFSNRSSTVRDLISKFDKPEFNFVACSEEDSFGSSDNDEETGPEEDKSETESEVQKKENKKQKAFMVAKEISSSEKVYVKLLKMINEDFREFVNTRNNESKKELLPSDKFNRIFSNIPQLQGINSDFLQDFEERIANWDSVKKISDVLVKKGAFLGLYSDYLRDFDTTTKLFEECCQVYPRFAKVVEEFEDLPICENLQMSMHFLAPVQRLPRYKLLLRDYIKQLEEDSEDYEDTTKALEIVSNAATKANNNMKTEKLQNMLKLQARVGDFELVKPGRELLKEGDVMKNSRSEVVPRYLILLNDCLLVTQYQVHGLFE